MLRHSSTAHPHLLDNIELPTHIVGFQGRRGIPPKRGWQTRCHRDGHRLHQERDDPHQRRQFQIPVPSLHQHVPPVCCGVRISAGFCKLLVCLRVCMFGHLSG
jgi:hypothetical protein